MAVPQGGILYPAPRGTGLSGRTQNPFKKVLNFLRSIPNTCFEMLHTIKMKSDLHIACSLVEHSACSCRRVRTKSQRRELQNRQFPEMYASLQRLQVSNNRINFAHPVLSRRSDSYYIYFHIKNRNT